MTRPIDTRDVQFMGAVGWSEQMLREIEAGWSPPYDSRALDQVRRDAMRAFAKDLPDPAKYAQSLPPKIAAALMDAVQGRNGALWAPDGPLVPTLRSLGLITIRDRELTGFAMDVRRELRIAAGEYVPPPKKAAKKRNERSLTASEVGHSAYGERFGDLAQLKRVESSAPCTLCGCRPDACGCRRGRR